ncbi:MULTISPECIES: hypothetical protein [Lysinibacillus]|uniref:Uncharacterized protein n=1 Tax=Lysinibacillus xylanilyticus TaxID=582475 RepID=A0ABV3W0Y5_9BACI
MIISKSMIDGFSRTYVKENSVVCYAESQTLSGASNKAILILNDSTLHILFLNITLSKVIQHTELSLREIQNSKLKKNSFFLSSVWSFRVNQNKWRFRIMKKIVTLGNMQSEFIKNIVI